VVAEGAERDVREQLVAHDLAGRLGDDDLAAVCGRADACRDHDVDPIVEVVDIAALLRDRSGTIADAVGALLSRGVDAIHCPVEQLGIQALSCLEERSVSIPEQVMLTTTNDAGRADVASVTLTTVDTDHAELGRLAVEALLEVIDGTRTPPFRALVETHVTPRASTARA